MLDYTKLDNKNFITSYNSSSSLQSSCIQIQNTKRVMLCMDHKEEGVSFISRAIGELKSVSLDKVSYLTDLTAVHYLEDYKEMTVVYNIKSLEQSFDIILLSKVNQEILTLTNLFRCANWLEREVFDMYGIWFKGHPQLRRILTDYGFKGFPLRKDFPLHGFKELRYDFEVRHLLYVTVKLSQDLRIYFFNQQWQKFKIK